LDDAVNDVSRLPDVAQPDVTQEDSGASPNEGSDSVAPDASPPNGSVLDGSDAEPEASGDATLDADAPTLTASEQALYDHAPSCLSCAQGAGVLGPGGLDTACETLGDAGAVDSCIATLQCILQSDCEVDGDPTACLCGAVDAAVCSNDQGGIPPAGPCANDYYTSFGTMDVGYIENNSFDPSIGAGVADTLMAYLATCPSCF
jgi:hypothetical protein